MIFMKETPTVVIPHARSSSETMNDYVTQDSAHTAVELPEHGEIGGSPEFFSAVALRNPIYLVSADMPGSGSTTLVRGMTERLAAQQGMEPYAAHAGQFETFDDQTFQSLPTDRPCIISGVLATALGPQYATPDRPVVCIDLVSQPLITAKRVLERDGNTLADIFLRERQSILGQLALTNMRMDESYTAREQALAITAPDDPNVYRFQADTSRFSAQELIEHFAGNGDFSQYVPEWEHQALQETLATLADLRAELGDRVHRIDVTHYDHHFEAIQYNAERLKVVLYPEGIAEVRATLRKAIADCWFGLTMKEIPRFFADQDGNAVLDTESNAWTPNFYKIAEAWPALSTILKDKSVLDPFGGAGTLMNLLIARCIPRSVVASDLAYEGGTPVNDTGNTYMPTLNEQAARLVFDALPSWYRPDFTSHKGYVTADARRLPFTDNAIDYIVGDPPYGRRHPTGGLHLLLSVLGECNRVAREGSIFLVPADWPAQIEAAGHNVERLTNDVSRGLSTHPVCYIRISARDGTG